MEARSAEQLYTIFKSIKASEYWDFHFNFGSISKVQSKTLSKDFVDLLIVNIVIPLQYAYYRYHQEDIADEIIELYKTIDSEKNTVINGWKNLDYRSPTLWKVKVLFIIIKPFVNPKLCLSCAIGFKLLKE